MRRLRGYPSGMTMLPTSAFSRDDKPLFGMLPIRDIERLREIAASRVSAGLSTFER